MKVVVVGGSGIIGSRIVSWLQAAGHLALAASKRSGVDTLTGSGLAAALDRADVVIDALNAPEAADPERFFADSTRTLLAAGQRAGVRHHVVVSIVGIDRLGQTAYFRGKLAQEQLVQAGTLPFTIVRSTQFLEFIGTIADAATVDGVVRVPPIFLQPISLDEAAAAVARVALGKPQNRIVEIAGPERHRLDELVTRVLQSRHDTRKVIADPDARYFGAVARPDTLLPTLAPTNPPG